MPGPELRVIEAINVLSPKLRSYRVKRNMWNDLGQPVQAYDGRAGLSNTRRRLFLSSPFRTPPPNGIMSERLRFEIQSGMTESTYFEGRFRVSSTPGAPPDPSARLPETSPAQTSLGVGIRLGGA
jgi:hypothetical protein